MSLKGDVNDLRKLRDRVKSFPARVAEDVAQRTAPRLTAEVQRAFDSGQTVYGQARPDGKSGPLSLVESGETRRALRFFQEGSRVRAALPTRWAKYLIGKYRILPMGRMPRPWSELISRLVRETKF